MTGIDTNVVVRYITQDDPVQSAAATKLFESLSSNRRGFVAMIVVVELVWVLQSCYKAGRNETARALETLLRSKELIVENADLVWQALRRFTSSNADFADCLVERCGHAAGCDHTLTFDQNAASAAGMKLLN
jgi:predicted nucleic-acid-binding protein